MKGSRRTNILRHPPRFALFATSYLPLFVLMILRQVSENANFLSFGGFSVDAIKTYLRCFGFSSILGAISILGSAGLIVFIFRMKRATKLQGTPAFITEIQNRNSEAISYIGTYIIPFLFQDYSKLTDTLSIGILLVVIYFIYVNSSLILINPVLNLRYSLYDVDFQDKPADGLSREPESKSGMLIIREKYLETGDSVQLRRIGQKLYFGTNA